jgi:hypothetical protein
MAMLRNFEAMLGQMLKHYVEFCDFGSRLNLTQVDRWRHSVNDVVEYVSTEKVTRIYFQHTSCIHTPEG